MEALVSYSQDNEEAIILEHFGGRIGRFLDIGAADGVQFSNTRALAEHGWHGVLVEPSPRQFMKLWDLYKDQSQFKLVNAALSDGSYFVEFHYSPDTVVNTINHEVHEEWSRDFTYWKWSLYTLPVYKLLENLPGPYDFISVGAEGESWLIAMELRPDVLGASLVCVEHDKHQSRGEARMKTLGYSKILENGNNTIWRRNAA